MINIFFLITANILRYLDPGRDSWVSPEVLIKNSMLIPNSGGGVLGG